MLCHPHERKESIMFGQRINLIMAVGTLCLLVGSASGKTFVAHKHPGRRHVMTRPVRPKVELRPVIRRPAPPVRPHRTIVNGRAYFHRSGPKRPHHHIVVVRTPYGRIIKAYPVPRIVTRFGVVEPTIVRVWFTNSNGSRTGVELVRRGLGYRGPRGEWYRKMPTQRQLWIAYGF